ncbi:hypothetical protein IEQ44_05325 [Nocardioides sp. Y6]|uniref:Lipoyl-binding domain-containing protein n=1 Tax=Nocardioides malaquae TaxID=2773426 RepID=A0ABR9RRN7_9ACTN|nr:hypothetical protein [Nocardioides malaquae]MBE7324065.1 hypothetical protein [Nocardioides malaquae]
MHRPEGVFPGARVSIRPLGRAARVEPEEVQGEPAGAVAVVERVRTTPLSGRLVQALTEVVDVGEALGELERGEALVGQDGLEAPLAPRAAASRR